MSFLKNNPLLTGARIVARLAKTTKVGTTSAIKAAKGDTNYPQLLRQSFEQMGTTYIKLGQFIASTPSLFPKEYVEAFNDFLDNTTPVDFADIKAVIDVELAHIGGSRAFKSIEPIALASASIAQVHKGTLPTGEVVAIKVQKKGVNTVINTDLSFLHGLFWGLEKVVPSFKIANLAPIVDEIRYRMGQETDFVAEQAHVQKFRDFLEKINNTVATAPKVYSNYSTNKILTMQFLEGVSLGDNAVFQKDINPAQIMGNVLDVWFMSLIQLGEFHADLHAGNLLLLDDNRVGFLDFGLVGAVPKESLQACLNMVEAMQKSDYDAMAAAMIAIGMTKNTNTTALSQDLQSLMQNKTADPTMLLAQLHEVGRKHGIHFPKDFALLVKQLLYFDRFLSALAPDMDMFYYGRDSFLH